MFKAAFVDRDGVINRKMPDGFYVTRWEEMQFLPGAIEGVHLLQQAGFRVIVVSNQRCVAKGLVTVEELESMHSRMLETFASAGAVIDAVYYCPHDNRAACFCRKPAPGMLLQAAREHHLNLAQSWMIGDADTDVAAGQGAGCKTARVSNTDNYEGQRSDVTAQSLRDAARQILQIENLSAGSQ
jgi:D-glycero-D-manno-heptose 1,7-bisphosphate phosphatase